MKNLREPLIAAACGLLALGFIAGLIALACDLFKDRGACLASRTTPAYSYVQPTFVPGPNGTTTIYTPVFVPEGLECVSWEFPEGRP